MPIRFLLFFLSILLFSAAGCTRDNTTVDTVPDSRSETNVTFSIRVPASYSDGTATVDENLIKSAYVLSFRADDSIADGDEPYDYSALAYSITDGTSSRYKTISVTLLKKDYPQRLVLITNAKRSVDELNLTAGDYTKDQVLEMLEFSKDDVWHSEATEFTPIPMWGESERVTIDDNTSTVNTIVLIRMVSRLDVQKDDAVTDELFTVTSVHLYNHLTAGRIAPNRESTHWDDSEYKALLPTMPTGGNGKVKGPLAASTVTASDGTAVIPTLYAFETETPSDGTAANATCIVIGGIYNESGTPSYYRVDFVNRDDNRNVTGYKNLLRNHIYVVNIRDVYGSGHPTPDEAFDSQAVNIDADVKEWDEGDITDVVFDKDYMLGVSQTEYNLPRNASTDNLLLVTTDVPAGWWIDDSATASWLTFRTGGFTVPEAKDEVLLDLEENDTGVERTTTFTVRADRLGITVTVIQGINEKYSIELQDEDGASIESLLITSYGDQLGIVPRTVKAIWTPATEACMVSYFPTGTGLGFDQRLNPFTETVIHGGEKQYTVYPDDITPAELSLDPFIEKYSRANLVVGDGSDAIVRTLTMRQVHYELVAEPAATYPLDGSMQSFTMATNAQWTVAVTGGNSDLANLQSTSGDAVPSGEEFYFKMAEDTDGEISDRTMELTFTYTGDDGRSATKTVTLTGEPARGLKDPGDANSYILQPDGEGVSIPLSWANGSLEGELIGTNDDVEVKVIWLTTDAGIGPSSVISSYALKGNGSSGRIEVYPGSQEGNALIAAMVGGEIKWSWHIWVTDYDIDASAIVNTNHTWMNINLGATTDTRGALGGYGLHYQWGRKDPFPYALVPVWDEEGKQVDFITTTNSSSDNILNAISNPTTFYYGLDWISTATSGNNQYVELWDEDGSAKSHYDPCPAGWRIPYKNVESSGPFTDFGWTRVWDSSGGLTFTTNGQTYFFQAAGRIDSAGNYEEGGSRGYYWSSISNESSAYGAMHFTFNSSSNSFETANRALGLSVRCVSE
ncbi:MAG: hypothetical protein LUF87_04405 [Alistipes sp.]|nr:hypothetical protein [Alistipes sp.]